MGLKYGFGLWKRMEHIGEGSHKILTWKFVRNRIYLGSDDDRGVWVCSGDELSFKSWEKSGVFQIRCWQQGGQAGGLAEKGRLGVRNADAAAAPLGGDNA